MDLQSGLSTVVIPRFPFHIGRTEADFLPFSNNFPDHRAALSRSHAQLSTASGKVFVEDLGSRNGTFLLDSRIEQGKSHELQNGDQLSFGPFFAYRVEIW
jgi:pSer/pThr/pTyr-binding forkhead associated (FHA) protein